MAIHALTLESLMHEWKKNFLYSKLWFKEFAKIIIESIINLEKRVETR